MRRVNYLFCWAVALSFMLLTACEPDEVSVNGVSFNITEFELKVGHDTVLTAVVTPDNATDKSLIWSSDNENVATVTDGRVKAIAEGSALIFVKTSDGGFVASCLVKVIPAYIAVRSVIPDKDPLELMLGQTEKLTATIIPDNATYKSLTWESSNTSVATIQDDIITAVGVGEAIITVTAHGGIQAELTVSVVEPYVQVQHMQADRLPDMLQARADHVLFVANGQLTVAGGHVSGFSPTASAEYLENGEWHAINMNYTHDMAFSVVMSNGSMMLGGGCSSGSGVGQSSYVELYDPSTHTFSIMPSMNNERTLSRAVELADGNVAVSGNWYASDAIELYSSSGGSFVEKATVSESRSTPYILRSAQDNAIIFGPVSNYGSTANSLIVDRLEGDPFTVDLFETWRPVGAPQNWRPADCAIADYSYLIQARNDMDQIGIIKVEGETFSMLETELPVPMAESGTQLIYSGQIFTDQPHKTAYLPAFNGNAETPVYYILKVDYSTAPAALMLYKTNVLDAYASIYCMTMLPDGRLVACGGISNSNYTPYSTVWAFSPF